MSLAPRSFLSAPKQEQGAPAARLRQAGWRNPFIHSPNISVS
jgi:hypothetical protein